MMFLYVVFASYQGDIADSKSASDSMSAHSLNERAKWASTSRSFRLKTKHGWDDGFSGPS
jgi:hypothetical protein